MRGNWRRKLAAFLTLVFLLAELPVVKSVAADYTETTYEAATATLYLAGEIRGKEDINVVLTAAGVSRSDVKKVVSLPGTKISGYCASIFAFSEAESIDLSNVDSSGCTDMRMMFAGSSKVKALKAGKVILVCGDYKLNVIAEDPSIEALKGTKKPYTLGVTLNLTDHKVSERSD